jgi:uncharacterized protein YndB with AHSA1/START domain
VVGDAGCVDEPTVKETIAIAASPGTVYGLVSDVVGMPEWAVECERCQWLGNVGAARPGARFRGRNRRGRHRWSTVSTVTAAEPGVRFSFKVSSLGMPVAAWAYDIEAADGGCVVTESTTYQTGFLLRRVLAPVATGVRTREERCAENRRNITRSLERLKTTAEASDASRG